MSPKPASIQTETSGITCPKCQRKPRTGDSFCRFDGEVLVNPKTCSCGAIGDIADNFCGKCGKPFAEPKIEAVPIPEQDPEFMALQEKLEAKARVRPSDIEAPTQELN
jgi:hypothetical protein